MQIFQEKKKGPKSDKYSVALVDSWMWSCVETASHTGSRPGKQITFPIFKLKEEQPYEISQGL